MCKDLVTSNLVFEVSIKNVNQAVTALRTYGLSEQDAVELIAKESEIAINDYSILPEEAISPELIEIFGLHYTSDSLTYVYHFMKEFKINWEVYKTVLNTLLDVFHLEELATSPERIKSFLTDVQRKARTLQRKEYGPKSVKDDEPPHQEYTYKILDNLKNSDISKILNMCGDVVIEETDDEKQYE